LASGQENQRGFFLSFGKLAVKDLLNDMTLKVKRKAFRFYLFKTSTIGVTASRHAEMMED
jgi:hypothetical protein